MAAQPTPQPEQGATPGAQPGGAPGQQQANPLQSMLAQLAKACETLAQQNPTVQGEIMEARTAFVKALQKTMQSPGGAGGGGQAPPPQGQ